MGWIMLLSFRIIIRSQFWFVSTQIQFAMCPPAFVAPAVELDDYWTDEVVCKVLMQLKSGRSLPSNVLTDVDPYQFNPSNLPGTWYFWSGTKKDAENGFWRLTGEACEIYSTPTIIGWRKTLQFYEGKVPNGEKTNWMMQEYTITEKYSSKSDPRGLYRVFLVDDSGSGQLSKSNLLEKDVDNGEGPSSMADRSPDPPSAMANRSADPSLGNYVSRDEYLELKDLNSSARSTSSTDSSGRTMSSDELFDSDALLREIENDIVDQEIQDSRINKNLIAPAKSKQVVMYPTTLESLDSGKEPKPSKGQILKTDPTSQNEPGDYKNENTLNGVNTSSSERKDGTKKHMMTKYLCFLAF